METVVAHERLLSLRLGALMRVDACYHRMRIRVKLTCDEMCGSVGAGDRTRSEASSFRRVTVNAHRRATSRGYPTTAMAALLAPKVGAPFPFLHHGGETKHSSGGMAGIVACSFRPIASALLRNAGPGRGVC